MIVVLGEIDLTSLAIGQGIACIGGNGFVELAERAAVILGAGEGRAAQRQCCTVVRLKLEHRVGVMHGALDTAVIEAQRAAHAQ